MAEVIDLNEQRAKRMVPPEARHTPITEAYWLHYEDMALAYAHVLSDYFAYFNRAETTDEQRQNLCENLHRANDDLFDAAKAYDESFGTKANGEGH